MRKGEAAEGTRSNWRCNVQCLHGGQVRSRVRCWEAVLITQQFGFLARLARCHTADVVFPFPPRLGPAAG